jgi:hypothetical protein
LLAQIAVSNFACATIFSKSTNALYTNHTTQKLEYFLLMEIAIYGSALIFQFRLAHRQRKKNRSHCYWLTKPFFNGIAIDIVRFWTPKKFLKNFFADHSSTLPTFQSRRVATHILTSRQKLAEELLRLHFKAIDAISQRE